MDKNEMFNKYSYIVNKEVNTTVRYEKEDIRQDCYLELLRALDNIKPGCDEKQIRGYLYSTIRGVIKNRIRKYAKDYKETNYDIEEVDISEIEHEESVESKFFDIENLSMARSTITQLSQSTKLSSIQRDVFTLSAKGYTLKEISQKLGIKYDTVRKANHSAMDKIRKVAKGE